MACLLRQRPLPAVARYSTDHDSWIARQAHIGPETQSLEYTGPEPLEQHIALLEQAQHELHALVVLEVDPDGGPTAGEHHATVDVTRRQHRDAGALDAQHIGAEVGEHHRAERHRPESGELDDTQPLKRSGATHYSLR